MGEYVDLLRSLPQTKRDISGRRADKSPEVIQRARMYGHDYFDGDRKYGYGGYKYDGRWQRVARDIMEHYFGPWVSSPKTILDVGCAKGFLVDDLVWGVGQDAYGIDISRYAVVEQPHPGVVGRLHLGSADELPFPDDSFDLVLSIDTIHNLPRERAKQALREIQRVSRGPAFVRVDAYRTDEERQRLEDWIITAQFWGHEIEWLELFAEAGYVGDYCWTKV